MTARILDLRHDILGLRQNDIFLSVPTTSVNRLNRPIRMRFSGPEYINDLTELFVRRN